MLRPRWQKLLRDLAHERGRMLMMMVAVTVSLLAVGAVLGAYAVLTREIARNYLDTHPASATLELPGGVDAAVLAQARAQPAVAQAEARDVILARAQVQGGWIPLLLFVADDDVSTRINTFTPISGTWPPVAGEMWVERTAIGLLDAAEGATVWVKTPQGTLTALPVAGQVHDPGLAPAWQERTAYGYITRATLGQLGEAPVLHELRIVLRDPAVDGPGIGRVADALAQQLARAGHAVHEIRIPPPRQHPHQRQMTTILFLMLAFSVMALILSAILVASSMAAMLARQVREIGVMKTLGARSVQIAGLYACLVVGIGLVALSIAMPAGLLAARGLAGAVAHLLNFTLTDVSEPAWVWGVQALAGLLVPLLMATPPIARASLVSVRQAIQHYGFALERARTWTALPQVLRTLLRRPARLLLTVALLASGGAMFMTALNLSAGWQAMIAKVYATRHYDVEVRFATPQAPAIARLVAQMPDVQRVESWGYSSAAIATPGPIDHVRTYPDRGHASFALMAPPADTRMVSFPLRAGRWLRADDRDAVVLNHVAAAQAPGVKVGDRVTISVDAAGLRQRHSWRVVGIVEEIGAAGVAYVTPQTFAQATGSAGVARVLRVATQAESASARTQTIRALERVLAGAGVSVELAVPLTELRTAMADHILILIRALIALACVMAIVGTLGLGAAMSVSVLERTREFGIMKTLGATPRRITRQLVAEAAASTGLSWMLAQALALPLTYGVGALVGTLGFVAPLPFVIAPEAGVIWFVLGGLVAVGATWLPARRAGTLTVMQALAY